MAFRSRRRRARGAWAVSIPTINDVTCNSTPTLDVFPVIDASVPDVVNVAAGFQTLAGNQLTSWMHKRTVGTVHIGLEQNDASPGGAGDIQTVEVFLGMFADRTAPPGYTLANLNSWDPWSSSAMRKRWLFRRHWVLGNAGFTSAHGVFGSGHYNWPETNANSFGMQQGPFVDIKMKQRISYEEQLWWLMAARTVEYISAEDAISVRFHFNVRTFLNVFQGDNR